MSLHSYKQPIKTRIDKAQPMNEIMDGCARACSRSVTLMFVYSIVVTGEFPEQRLQYPYTMD